MDPAKVETSNSQHADVPDVNEKHDAIIQEAEEALHGVEMSMLLDPELKAELPPFFSKECRHVLFACASGYFATVLYGYDAGVMSGINVMPHYQAFFGVASLGGATGLIFSLFYAGALVGIASGYWLSDRWGRKMPILVGSVVALCGAIIQASSYSIQQFRAARFILGYGSSMCFAYGPLLTVEMAHPFWRGRLGGLLMIGVLGGNTFSLWMDFACAWSNSDFSWRFPLAFQVLPPILSLSFSIICPESPRWLMSKGRNEEALAILTEYHGFGNPDSKLVKLEYAELAAVIKTGDADSRWWDFIPIFQGPGAIYRIACVINLGILYQWSGNSLGIYYLPVMIAQAGVKNYHISLLITCITSTVALGLALLGSWLLDKWGRKYSLMFALAGMATTLSILSGLQSPGKNMTPSETHASIAIIMLFRFTYALGMTPVEALYAVEMLPQHIRAKAQCLTSLILTAALFASTYASPVALANIAWKYYLVFISLDIVWFFVIWFLYPETKGRTIEEMQAIFESPNPVKASREAARRAEL